MNKTILTFVSCALLAPINLFDAGAQPAVDTLHDERSKCEQLSWDGELEEAFQCTAGLWNERRDEMSVEGLRVVLKSGYFRLALMTFLNENSLNFRGADVFAVHD